MKLDLNEKEKMTLLGLRNQIAIYQTRIDQLIEIAADMLETNINNDDFGFFCDYLYSYDGRNDALSINTELIDKVIENTKKYKLPSTE